jgi:hypothetical protein
MFRSFFRFGVLGWFEIFFTFAVAIGCLGELWILLNRLTRHVEPLAKSSGAFWKMLAKTDAFFRPIAVRLKINGRKLSETKEHLLERFFVMLVAFGVSGELISAASSLKEIADLNDKASEAKLEAGKANKLGAEANERASSNEVKVASIIASNLVLEIKLEEIRSNSFALEEQMRPRTIEITRPATKLKAFAGTNAFIITAVWGDCLRTANQIGEILGRAGWKVSGIRTEKAVPDGVTVGISSSKNEDWWRIWHSGPDVSTLACVALLDALNQGGIAAKLDERINSTTSIRLDNTVIVLVGPRPGAIESEIDRIENQQRMLEAQRWKITSAMATNFSNRVEMAALLEKANALDNISRTNSTRYFELQDNLRDSMFPKETNRAGLRIFSAGYEILP